ncbi:MAG: DUF2088 domain-containing protein [Bryobacterales bacterium]|nr:DUF2088 domain-containing protein [Bryobacterales bacterium]
MAFPRMMLVRQHFPNRAIADISAAVTQELAASNFASKIPPGGSVAIGVGSRGIMNIDIITRAVVDYWKSIGRKPFLFPAMGSHGAATAEGQADVLAHYGITEASIGCPLHSQLEVVSLGKTEAGIEAYMDRLAFESDGVMMIGRVKWHTDFVGKIESGLFKMMAIGLGKFAGAKIYHSAAYRSLGLGEVVLTVGRQVLASGKVIGGLAVLEDANHATAKLAAVPAETMERDEEELLNLVSSWNGRVPLKELDILIVDEMGKHISGAGMDTKVINRSVWGEANCFPDLPLIRRVFVRSLSSMSYGNAVGIGLADMTTDSLLASIDWHTTHINSITANSIGAIRTPIHFPTDRDCMDNLCLSVGIFDDSTLTIGRIRNTMHLELLELSETLRAEVEANPALEILDVRDFTFERDGNLPDIFGVQSALAH